MRYIRGMQSDPIPASPFEILAPAEPRAALVVASPHSGTQYPPDLIAGSRLSRLALRRSEDSFVDEIFGQAPRLGVPLIHALFPRVYIDPNREPYELDPQMFEDDLPGFVNRTSPRVAAGLGTIARIVADGDVIYRHKLRFAEAERRIDQLYRPYHAALSQLVDDTVTRFGCCVLIDAHSMPSQGARGETQRRRIDFVLGDRQGTSCHPSITRTAEAWLRDQGYAVALNSPYAGGFTTMHYGRPAEARHCLQIEINRALYMDESSFTAKPYLTRLQADMARMLSRLAAIIPTLPNPTRR